MEDWPYSFAMIPLDELFVDESYQRPLTNYVGKIVDNYDPRMMLPLVVSQRDDRAGMAVVDGQTRMTALRQLGHDEAPCVLFQGTAKDEAMLFARFQAERKNIKPFHRWRAMLRAGDPVARKVKDVCDQWGYELGDKMSSTHPWMITAVTALEDLARAGTLSDLLEVTSQAWPPRHDTAQYGKGHPLNNEVIRGLAYFMDKFEWDPDRLVRALGSTTPQELNLRAGHLRQGRGMGGKSPSYMSEAIRAQYSQTKK